MVQIILKLTNISCALIKNVNSVTVAYIVLFIYLYILIRSNLLIALSPLRFFFFFFFFFLASGIAKSLTLTVNLCIYIFLSVNLCFICTNVIKLCYIHRCKTVILFWWVSISLFYFCIYPPWALLRFSSLWVCVFLISSGSYSEVFLSNILISNFLFLLLSLRICYHFCSAFKSQG